MKRQFIVGAIFSVALLFTTALSISIYVGLTGSSELEAWALLPYVAVLGGALNVLLGLGGPYED